MSTVTSTDRVSRNDPTYVNLGVSGIDTSSLPDDYKKLSENNPFLNYDYTPTLMDKIGNFFGFGTAEDKFRTEMHNAARLHDSQLLSLAAEREYNSPANQAALTRQAGLNPDLVGIQGSPAPEFNESEASPQAPDGSQEVMSFAGNMLSVFTTTMGLVKDVVGLSGFMEDLSAKRTANLQSFMEAARSYVLETVNPSGWLSSPDQFAPGFTDPHETAEEQAKRVNNYARSMYGSRSDRRKFLKALDVVTQSLPTEIAAYKAWHERESARRDYAKDRSSKYYASSDDQMSEFLSVLVQGLENLNEKTLKNDDKAQDVRDTSLDVQSAQNENDLAYLNTVDPVLEGRSVNETNKKVKESNKTENEINQVYRDIVHELSSLANGGNRWAQVGLLVISALRMMSLPQYSPQSSRPTGQNGSSPQNMSYPPGEDFDSYWMGMK